MKTKICPTCNIQKPISEFHKGRYENRTAWRCRECTKKYHHQWYSKNKNKRIKQTSIYIKKHRKHYNELGRKWRKNNPEKSIIINHESKRTPRGIYRGIVANAKRENRNYKPEVKITIDEFENWYNDQERICYYCGIPENKLLENRLFGWNKRITRLSVDRSDNNKGYELGNIVLCCMRCNHIKSNFFTTIEMKEIAKKYIKPKWE